MSILFFTPGPWRYVPFTGDIIGGDYSEKSVAKVTAAQPDGVMPNEIKANGQLISSSPDLLSSLVTLTTMLKNHGFKANHHWKAQIETAEAAIKKATTCSL